MKTQILSVIAITAIGFIACNDNASDTAGTGDTATAVETGTTSVSTTTNNNYTALADTFRTNSEAGNYLDPRSGKPVKISVDPQTGVRTNAETGQPVWRYVDKRTWWVYGGEGWDTVGSARMDGSRLTYRGDNDKWVNYDERWKADDDRMMSDWKSKNGNMNTMDSSGSSDMNNSGTNSKMKAGDLKIKTEKDGDVKIKTEGGLKIKKDEDGMRVKRDSSK